MKRHDEEDLIRLAFGELLPAETANLERSIQEDAEALAALRLYREMAAGLKELPVAECQLSTERLRDAILSKGLGRSSIGTGLRWVWAPAALALLLLALPIARRFLGDEPLTATRIDGGSRSVTTQPDASLRPRGEARDPAPEVEAATGAVVDRALDPGRPPRVASRAVAPRPPAASRAMGSESRAENVALLSRAELDMSAIETAVAEAAVPETASETFVIIGTETDSSTGARRAMEVPTASNVVVGG